MKTLADLKRYLKVGTIVKMIHSDGPTNRLLNKKRKVVAVQTNGVCFVDPDDTNSKKSFLEFPKASLIEITDKSFKIYTSGLRDLTTEEKKIRDNIPKDTKQEHIDLMTDGSTMYWREKKYYIRNNAEYLMGNKSEQGMRYDFNTSKIYDDNVKGDLSLEYEFIANEK
jgi:hypothetical protein